METAFEIYMGLGLASLSLLTLLLPLCLLPATLTNVPSREFGVFHSSIVLAAWARSAFVVLEAWIWYHKTSAYEIGLPCDVDAVATFLLTMVVVYHFPLLAINMHFKVTTRDNPPEKLFSTSWSVLWCFLTYVVSSFLGIGILVTWGADSSVPLGVWVGQHCVVTMRWMRLPHIILLFVPLTLALVISIPCVLSVTLRHHRFCQRDIRALRIEVGTLYGVALLAIALMVAVWAKPVAEGPRPLEATLGLLVFLLVLNERVITSYRAWLGVIIIPFNSCFRRFQRMRNRSKMYSLRSLRLPHDEENTPMGYADANGYAERTKSDVNLMQPPGYFLTLGTGISTTDLPAPEPAFTAYGPKPVGGVAGGGDSVSSSKRGRGRYKNRILPTADLSAFITRIRPTSIESAAQVLRPQRMGGGGDGSCATLPSDDEKEKGAVCKSATQDLRKEQREGERNEKQERRSKDKNKNKNNTSGDGEKTMGRLGLETTLERAVSLASSLGDDASFKAVNGELGPEEVMFDEPPAAVVVPAAPKPESSPVATAVPTYVPDVPCGPEVVRAQDSACARASPPEGG